MDDGTWFCFPNFGNDRETSGTGFAVRKDYLDAVGAEAPQTVEEWYDVLTKFKTELDLTAPLTFEARWFFLEYAAAGTEKHPDHRIQSGLGCNGCCGL